MKRHSFPPIGPSTSGDPSEPTKVKLLLAQLEIVEERPLDQFAVISDPTALAEKAVDSMSAADLDEVCTMMNIFGPNAFTNAVMAGAFGSSAIDADTEIGRIGGFDSQFDFAIDGSITVADYMYQLSPTIYSTCR